MMLNILNQEIKPDFSLEGLKLQDWFVCFFLILFYYFIYFGSTQDFTLARLMPYHLSHTTRLQTSFLKPQ
jgi:hypothetical protein